MSKKHIISLLVCIIMLVGIVAGCSSKTSTDSNTNSNEPDATTPAEQNDETNETADETSDTPAEPVTVSLLIDNQAELSGIEAVIDAIEEKFNISTEIDLRPGGDEGDNVVKTRLATGDMADLCFYNSGSLFMALNPPEHFVDLTDEPYMDTIDESFKLTVTVDGRVYGIPSGTAIAGAWLYNKKIYEELGLSIPKTWEQLMDNCEQIKEAGITPVLASYRDSWTAQLILLADYYNVHAQLPTFAEDYTANKAKFSTTPIALRGFEKLQEVHTRGFLNQDFLATTYEDALKMLAEGEGAHYPMLSFALPVIAENYPDKIDDIGLFAQPGDSEDTYGLTVWMPGGVYLNKHSEHVDALKKWAEFYVSREGIDVYMSAQKPQGPFAIKGIELPDDVWPAVKDTTAYFDAGNTAPALEFISPLKGPNLPQICVEVGSGITSPKAGAEAYDADVEKQAKQLNLPGW